jgi:uncharacterized protein
MMRFKGIWQSASASVQIMYFLLLMLASMIVCSLLGFAGVMALGNPPLHDFSNETTIAALKWMQGCSSIGIFVIPPLLFAYLAGWHFSWKKVSRQQLLLSIALLLLLLPMVNAMAVWNEGLSLPSFLGDLEAWMKAKEAEAMLVTESFLTMNTLADLLINILIMALIPAVGEELLFRGLIQKGIQRWKGNAHLAIWLTAFLFSVMHMQFLGFFPRLFLGAVLGYLFLWSGSLVLPIAVHFANNALAVSTAYMVGHQQVDASVEQLGADNNSVLLVSLMGASLLIYFLLELREKE